MLLSIDQGRKNRLVVPGIKAALGRIAPGYRADLVLLDDDLHVTETWIAGVVAEG